MKPGLQLQIGQQLTMTPQLQQAIRLLQLSSLELRQEIRQALETNPMLEAEEENPEETEAEAETEQDRSAEDDSAPVETDWDDIWLEGAGSGSTTAPVPEDETPWEERNTPESGLHDHLFWQLNLTPMSDADRTIGYAIIEGLDDDGYLRGSLDDIAEAARREIGDDAPDEAFPEEDEVLAVLHRIQQFDPPGVAARDLCECLLLQLRQLPRETPWRDQAMALLDEHPQLLENGDEAALRRRLGLSREELGEVLALLRGLHPAPGDSLGSRDPDYVIPDVILTFRDGRWHVELNPEVQPRIRLNDQYAALVGRGRNPGDNEYLKERLQEARWFIKSLHSRNETLLRVATRIVEVQQDFFRFGEEAMKPLVLSEVAEALEMHESTISRVTNQKYMLTPRGVLELKYFFSSHVATRGGGECSSTAIRAIIRRLINAEDAAKPLSDSKLTGALNEQGIEVARRTVAKYREAMNIPPSSERKRLV